MAPRNIRLAQEAYDAVAGRDLDRFLGLADRDIEIIARYTALEGTSFRGHEGVRRWWRNLHGTFPDFSPEVEVMREVGDLVFAAVRIRGSGARSGAPFEETVWQLTEWRDGKCRWWRTYGTEAEAVEVLRRRSAASRTYD